MIKTIFQKYKSLIMYAFFGVCTTLVNLAVYYLTFNILNLSNVLSTIIAWIVAVLFAFVTNKIWVFDSKSWKNKVLFHELWTFFAARIATGVLDVLIMYVAVDVLQWSSTLCKLISNTFVIILNFVFSKCIIFNKTERQKADS